jgi:hypothetical protein
MSEDWIATNHRVVEEFRANGGRVKGRGPLVLLTIKGAKSGQPRVYPLMSVPYEGGYLAVASRCITPIAIMFQSSTIRNASRYGIFSHSFSTNQRTI